MVKGKVRTTETEEEDYTWMNDIIDYQESLDNFFGGIYKSSGLFDETEALSKLIELVGKQVISEEKEYNAKLKNEYDPESDNHTELAGKYSYLKSYRALTYRALLMLVHSCFEARLNEFCSLLVKHKRNKETTVPSGSKTEGGRIAMLLEDFLFVIMPPIKSKIEKKSKLMYFFNAFRNKINHRNGLFVANKNNADIVLIKEVVKDRSDFSIKVVERRSHEKLYQIAILKSSFIKDYLGLVIDTFKMLETFARKM